MRSSRRGRDRSSSASAESLAAPSDAPSASGTSRGSETPRGSGTPTGTSMGFSTPSFSCTVAANEMWRADASPRVGLFGLFVGVVFFSALFAGDEAVPLGAASSPDRETARATSEDSRTRVSPDRRERSVRPSEPRRTTALAAADAAAARDAALPRVGAAVSVSARARSAASRAARFAASSLASTSARRRSLASSPRRRRASATRAPIAVSTNALPPSEDPEAASRARRARASSSIRKRFFRSAEARADARAFRAFEGRLPGVSRIPAGFSPWEREDAETAEEEEDMPTREACSETPSRPSASPVAARVSRARVAAAEAFAEALAPTTRTGVGGALVGAFAVSSAGVVSHPGRPSLGFSSIAVSRAAACSRAASRAAARSFFNISSRFCSRSRAAVFSCASLTRQRALLSAMNACTSARRAASSCSAAVARGGVPGASSRVSRLRRGSVSFSFSPKAPRARRLAAFSAAGFGALSRRAAAVSLCCLRRFRSASARLARSASAARSRSRRSLISRMASRGGGSATRTEAPGPGTSPSFPENASPSTSASAAASAMSDRSSALASMCACFSLLTRSARSREEDARNDAASSSVGAGVLTNDASHALGCGERAGDLPGVTLASRDTVFLCIASDGVGGSVAPRIAASSATRSSAGDMAPGDRWMRDVQTLRRTSNADSRTYREALPPAPTGGAARGEGRLLSRARRGPWKVPAARRAMVGTRRGQLYSSDPASHPRPRKRLNGQIEVSNRFASGFLPLQP